MPLEQDPLHITSQPQPQAHSDANTSADIKEVFSGSFDEFKNSIISLRSEYGAALNGLLEYKSFGPYLVCSSLFPDHLSNDPIGTEEVQSTVLKLDMIRQSISPIIERLLASSIPNTVKNMYLRSFDNLYDRYSMLMYATFVEAEKGGWIANPSWKKIYVDKIQELQNKIFGPALSDVPVELGLIMRHLESKFSKNKDLLTEMEQTEFQNYLNLFKTKPLVEPSPVVKSRSTTIVPGSIIPKDKVLDIVRDIQKIYQSYYLTVHELPVEQWDVEINNTKDNLWVDPFKKKIYISDTPGSTNISVQKLLQILVGHEMERHRLSGINTSRDFGEGFMSPDYQALEEGLAKLHEAVVVGKIASVAELPVLSQEVSLGMISALFCDFLPAEEAIYCMQLYLKLGKYSNNPETLIRRSKAFVALGDIGSNHKEMIYHRGSKSVVSILSKEPDLDKAFEKFKNLGRRLDEIDYINLGTLQQELGFSGDAMITPLFLSKIIYDKILGAKGSANNYILADKYPPMPRATKIALMELKNKLSPYMT